MDLEISRSYRNKYDWFNQLLILFLLSADGVPGYEKSDEEIVKAFIDETASEDIRTAIKQGRELLRLSPFPWEWIQSATNRLVYDKRLGSWEEEPELYEEWVRWMVDKMLEEGKKAGKV